MGRQIFAGGTEVYPKRAVQCEPSRETQQTAVLLVLSCNQTPFSDGNPRRDIAPGIELPDLLTSFQVNSIQISISGACKQTVIDGSSR